jgi:MFS transporter, DHA2 family, methylenomycin A resistance protein
MNLEYLAKVVVMSERSGAVTLLVAIVACFLVFLDTTVVNVALPSIGASLKGGRADLEWLVDGYTLAFAAGMLNAGALADSFGARRVFVIGLVVFAAASVACAVPANVASLIGARVVQGVGGALLLPSSLTLATSGLIGNARERAVSRWAAAGGIGVAAGPLVGGLVVEAAGWRWVFLINVVIGAVALILTVVATSAVRPRPRRLDLGGQVTASLAIGSFVFALIEGPRLGWSSLAVTAALALVVAAATGFIVSEREAPNPIMPLGLAAQVEFAATSLLGALFNFTFYGVIFALTLLLQQGRGDSPLVAGLSFLPLTGLIAVGNLTAPRLASRRSANFVLHVGQALLGFGLLAALLTATLRSPWPLLLSLVPAGFGSGLLVPTMTSRLLQTAPDHLRGVAAGAFNASRQIGGAVGVAVFGSLLGAGTALDHGFRVCLTLSLAAIAASALVTATALRRGRAVEDAQPVKRRGRRIATESAQRRGAAAVRADRFELGPPLRNATRRRECEAQQE